jgi:chromosome partitioning protein
VATIVSLINLKGGVGKTTTTVQLAEALACPDLGHRKKVLVIDLDPQTNATVALIDEITWKKVNEAKNTLFHLFEDWLENSGKFSLGDAILKNVSNLRLQRLDLLASSIDLVKIDENIWHRIFSQPHKKSVRESKSFIGRLAGTLRIWGLLKNVEDELLPRRHRPVNPHEFPSILRDQLLPILGQYDFVLIDCPPNLGPITCNALEASDFYLIPVIPDILSTYGIPQIIKTVFQKKKERGLSIRCLGVLITKYLSNSGTHQEIIQNLQSKINVICDEVRGHPPVSVFRSRIPQADRLSAAMFYAASPATFSEKWGYSSSGGQPLHYYVRQLAAEFLEKCSSAGEA